MLHDFVGFVSVTIAGVLSDRYISWFVYSITSYHGGMFLGHRCVFRLMCPADIFQHDNDVCMTSSFAEHQRVTMLALGQLHG